MKDIPRTDPHHHPVATLPEPPPLVSVIITSRNRERFLGEALKSLASQTYPVIEVVAVDDGSTDATGRILEAFASSHPRVRVIRTCGIGPAAARDRAFRAARGDFFALQDDDDLSRPERIELQVRHMLAHPEIEMLGTAAEIIDERGRSLGPFPVPIAPARIRGILARRPPFVHGSILMRRETYFAAGGYRAAFPVVEDYDLYLRVPGTAGLANLPQPLYAWRHHGENTLARLPLQHYFYVAAARAFVDERRETGADSVGLLERSEDPERFLAAYPRSGRLLSYLGEGHARSGRLSFAYLNLARAVTRPGARVRSLAWLAVTPATVLAWHARRMIVQHVLGRWEPGH